MITAILGNQTVEKILIFMELYGESYPTQLSKLFEIPLRGIQQQLERLENGGIIVSRLVGKTRLYQWNPRCVFLKELSSLLRVVYNAMPENEKNKFRIARKRPRKFGKPI